MLGASKCHVSIESSAEPHHERLLDCVTHCVAAQTLRDVGKTFVADRVEVQNQHLYWTRSWLWWHKVPISETWTVGDRETRQGRCAKS